MVKRISDSLRLDVDVDPQVCEKINQHKYENTFNMIAELLDSFRVSGPSAKKQRIKF
jgi:hypothetical protein